MTEDTFDLRISQTWAEQYGCDVAVTGQPGATVVARDRLEGTGAIDIWNIGAHAFVDADPGLASSLERIIADSRPGASLTVRQYRCDVENVASRRVAEVTGYTLHFTNEAITIIG